MTNDAPNSSGPSHETLRGLAGMLPSFIKGMANKMARGKGIPCQVKRPRKCCKVCGLLFDHIMALPSAEMSIEGALCERCDGMLKEGYTAIVCGEKFAFVKSPLIADWVGEIKQVSQIVMEAIENKFGQASTKIKPDGNDQPPAN